MGKESTNIFDCLPNYILGGEGRFTETWVSVKNKEEVKEERSEKEKKVRCEKGSNESKKEINEK